MIPSRQMSSSGLQIENKIRRGKSLNEAESILFERNISESLCPIVAITAKFLWGWSKPKGHFPVPHIQSPVFQSELHACSSACFFWGDRGWIFTAHEFKQNFRVFHRSIPVSVLFSRLSCSETNLMVVGCWKGWTHLFPFPGLRCYFFCLTLLFSPPNGEPLQGVAFLQKACPSLLPTWRKTFCCFRSQSWIPESWEKRYYWCKGGSGEVRGRKLSDHPSYDLKLYPNLRKLVT